MTEQTSASDRVEQARRIIAAHDAAVDAYADATDLDEAYAAEARMEDATSDAVKALRALITPPSVGESVEQIAKRRFDQLDAAILTSARPHPEIMAGVQRMMEVVAEDAIYAAHTTWEPADRPSQEQMLRWLGIEYDDRYNEAGYEDGFLVIEQFIEREEL